MPASHHTMTLVETIKPLLDNDIVLIVDDMPNNLKVLSDTLADAGFEVAIAISGESALQQLEHTAVSLILLDVMMPGIDGFETCQRLKANAATATIPVIFMTALSESVNKVKGFEMGAVDYITKPFQQGEVMARVRTHLKLSQLSHALEVRNTELQQLAGQLEQRVAERTQALSTSLETLKQTQLQLVQSEKMSALGNLVAGVAHEINNPVGFIAGNLEPALEYVKDIFGLVDLYQQKYPLPDEAIQAEIESIDLEYVREDLPKLIASMKLGVDRICSISTSLRTFSRADKDYKVPFNIHDGLDSTLLILRHRLKANDTRPEIAIRKIYGDLPPIECFPGQLNQVFMNILANAIDALEEARQKRPLTDCAAQSDCITIQTRLDDADQVVIYFRDNGLGMSDVVRQRVFEHLFTTKAVGEGTGLGLAIAQQIVAEKHSGTLQVNSTLGEGTAFVLTLPVKAPD